MSLARVWRAAAVLGLLVSGEIAGRAAETAKNLVADGSFEEPMAADQFGHVFKQWSGWKYEGPCEFRVGQIAHSGKTSSLLFASGPAKIRLSQTIKGVPAGRYKLTAWLRGLDIGEGQWRMSTELMLDGQYMPLKKNGTFGWTPVSYVVEIKQAKDVELALGLWAPGYLWIDDVSLVSVPADTPGTEAPQLGAEEKPIAPPGPLTENAIRCPACGYRNAADTHTCYACGAELSAQIAAHGPAIKTLASFEEKNPFDGGSVATSPSEKQKKALKLDKGYAAWSGPQNWSGYDYLMADVYCDSQRPTSLRLELQDRATRDYWTRVNYETLLPPGKSTLAVPLAQLYVGEKARPGRKLLLDQITKFVPSLDEKATGAVYFTNLRLERDTQAAAVQFNGLHAFSFGPADAPLMPGFTRVDPSTIYSVGRGYGLKDAQVWRPFNVLQPDPLYQSFLCLTGGGFVVDLPKGKYHVLMNLDNPSGFWGEYQNFRERTVLAQGKPVVRDTMTFDSLKRKYFRHWDTEDLPTDDTFDKYQRDQYHEKQFDVEVTDGQLRLEFHGEAFANSLSALVIYPADKEEQGRAFLDWVTEKRRFFFNNYFHRVLHRPNGVAYSPTADDIQRGYKAFPVGIMYDKMYFDTPSAEELAEQHVSGFGFAGQYQPVSMAVCPLADLGKVTVTVSDLKGPGVIHSGDIAVGYVSYRLTRVSADGAVYTILPRYILPRSTVEMLKWTRRFWLTVHPPADAKPGVYKGTITITPERGQPSELPLEYRVYPGQLDPVDVPVGPFAHEINIPWDSSDRATAAWNRQMAERSLRKLRDYGFTSFSGMPVVRYLGFKDGQPQLDFSRADEQMKLARDCGFSMPVVSYCEFSGLNLHYKDEAAMQAAGFSDYSKFIKAIFTAVQKHADEAAWLPVYWTIADEPVGDDVLRARDNAAAFRAAFPKGPPLLTGATSFDSGKPDDPHFLFARELHVPCFNGHNQAAVEMIHQAGDDWAFYNNASRWTYGIYMYKAVKQFGMKFRLGWHWHAAAGDPYYALDCREDDYCWCNANADGELIPTVDFERQMRGGVDDYRMLLTLGRLAMEKHDAVAQRLIDERMASFKLGDTEPGQRLGDGGWTRFRRELAEAIGRLSEQRK